MRNRSTAPGDTEEEQPFLSHLVELRDRLLRAVVGVLIAFLGVYPFANDIYAFIAGPLLEHLPEGSSMIAIDVATPFLTPFKLAMVGAIFVAMPWILYQLWAFVAPGLYRHERRMVIPLLATSSLLFYVGAAFAYFVVFPLVFAFMSGIVPEGVEMMTDINRYLDFVLTIFFAFGIAFEIPIATIVLVWTGVTDRKSLAAKRPYIIVGAFVIGMLLTPPDIISQTLLALPMWVLFELGVVFARFYVPPENAPEEEAELTQEGLSELHDENHPMDKEVEGPETSTTDPEHRRYTGEGLENELDELADQGEADKPSAPRT